MKATAEPLEDNKVKLSVEIPEDEFDQAVERAFRDLARQIRIPGFRPGKAPRKVLEKRIGVEAAREEAIRTALPEYFAQAALDTDTDAIAPPEIDIASGRDVGPLVFDAVVQVRQKITLNGYEALQVTVPSPLPAQEEIDGQLERLRRQSSTIEPVDRPAIDGDQVRIDIAGTHQGEPVPGLTADDYLYEVGAGSVVPELDAELRGAKVGEIREFAAVVPGGDDDTEPLQLRVLVKEVNQTVLPELTDAWAADASEFDTVQELRADITERMTMVKKVNSIMALRQATLDALIELVDVDPMDAHVQLEMQERLHQLQHRLEDQGMSLQQYFASTGRAPDEIEAELKDAAVRSAKADLAIRALIAAEGLEATDADIDAEIDKAAAQNDRDPAELKAQLAGDDRLHEIRFDISRSKAIDWLVEHVAVVDEEGKSVDRSLLEPPTGAEAGPIGHIHSHDDDHDHDDHDHELSDDPGDDE